jgi:sugar/nucleoside kinase (ribokinase family)
VTGGPDPAAARNLLLGALSLDLYRDGTVLPGGGVLNMAWHWWTLGVPFHLLTRVGADHAAVARRFLDRHGISYERGGIVGVGPSATIDIEILPDGQPHMDRFVEGVWADYRSTPDEEALIAGPGRLHAVLVEGAIRELARLQAAGRLADREVTADFLGFRHYTVERFADTMAAVDVGFVGWPGYRDDPTVTALAAVTRDLGRRLVVTFGSAGVLLVDGRSGAPERFFPVTPIPVVGTTVGCGDAFIAYCLAEYMASGDLAAGIERGMVGGALATAWPRPLPDEAYEALPSD